LRRYVDVRSGRDTDLRDTDQGDPGELAALADHVAVDPGGGLHGREPGGWGRAGQGVAAAFGGGDPGELGRFHVTFKMLKRQMFGRAGFVLLRHRILLG
jgi:hypothetical protein